MLMFMIHNRFERLKIVFVEKEKQTENFPGKLKAKTFSFCSLRNSITSIFADRRKFPFLEKYLGAVYCTQSRKVRSNLLQVDKQKRRIDLTSLT